MTINPKRYGEQMNTLVHVWTTSNSKRSYSGLSLTELRLGLQPSIDARTRVAAAQTELALAIRDRDAADATTIKMYKRAISAIEADPHEAGKSELLDVIMASTRKARRSGTTPPAVTVPAPVAVPVPAPALTVVKPAA